MNKIEILEREGGHILILFLLFIVCLFVAVFTDGGIQTLALSCAAGSYSSLLYCMKGSAKKPGTDPDSARPVGLSFETTQTVKPQNQNPNEK